MWSHSNKNTFSLGDNSRSGQELGIALEQLVPQCSHVHRISLTHERKGYALGNSTYFVYLIHDVWLMVFLNLHDVKLFKSVCGSKFLSITIPFSLKGRNRNHYGSLKGNEIHCAVVLLNFSEIKITNKILSILGLGSLEMTNITQLWRRHWVHERC